MKNKIYLSDIGGYPEEKAEAQKIVNIFRNYETYKENGAYIPKGCILSGAPGIGKTMFAKAISCEADVPFYELEQTDNDEETVKNIKEVFKKAKETTPSVIFIDEIGELVETEMFISDTARKTLKTLLTEIDGVKSSDGVMVIATTNKMSEIPEALIRSGRMDKKIEMDLPDFESRKAILELYLSKTMLCKMSSMELARKTGGLSGADLKSLVNEMVMKTIEEGKNLSEMDISKIITSIRFNGLSKLPKKEPEDFICYHEIGHFITSYKLNNEIANISTEQVGNVRGFINPEDYDEEKDIISKTKIMNMIIISMGGMAAENIYMGEPYSGSSSDINKARRLVEWMMECGMYGFKTYITGKTVHGGNILSEEGYRLENSILEDCYNKAHEIITEEKDMVSKLLPELKSRLILSKNDIMAVLGITC